MKSGIIGFGVIGQEIAHRLQGWRHSVYVYDKDRSLIDQCRMKSAEGVLNIRELSVCEAIFICVNGDRQIESVMSGEGGLLEI